MKTLSFLTDSALVLVAASLLTGCSPESSTMTITPAPVKPYQMPKPEPKHTVGPMPVAPTIPNYPKVERQKFDWVYEDGGQRQLESKPQVDILFVVDNSDSMRSAQANLVRNIGKFSDVFGRIQMIDYHIGVISVWDYSQRFAEKRKDTSGIGELRFVKDSKGQTYSQRFVTRKESPLLASTLNIGVEALKDGGPEVEEIFAPLAAALEKSGNGAPNDGFFRPDAQLVVIFLTDADEPASEDVKDSSVKRLSVGDMYDKLVQFKGNDPTKISAYGVLVPETASESFKDPILRLNPNDNPQCFDTTEEKTAKGKTKKVVKFNDRCPKQFGPAKLESLIMKVNEGSGTAARAARTFIKDLTAKDYGADLTSIGTGISKKTLEKVIELNSIPLPINNVPQVEVYYGSTEDFEAGKAQLIPFSRQNGWTYDPIRNTVVLSGDIQYQNKQNARYIVRMKVAPLE